MNGRDQYKSSVEHAEDLSDPALGLDLDCIRSNIILKTDDAVKQFRQAVYGVGTGTMTIDEAIAGYGTFTD